MKDFLQQAIELSKKSVEQGGFPAGALIVKDGIIISQGLSNGKDSKDSICHAEIEAIRNASLKLNNSDLVDCEVYSSMEPCLMCFSACYWAKIKKVVYAVSKNDVSEQYYEGVCSLEEVNSKNNRQIEIVHIKDFENEGLKVVKGWENDQI